MASKIPELFFDARGDGYWLRLSSGRYLQLGKKDVSLHLMQAGLVPDQMMGPMRAIDRAYWVAQVERSVDYAGPLAGHRCGAFCTQDGKRVLVTSEARIPDRGKDEDCPFLEKFLGELLGHDADQLSRLLGWFNVTRKAQLAGDFRPGQMLVLAGPSGCGKSLFQSFVTAFLGGRVGKPYRYMTAETSFNSDVCAAEHWAIEDENASTDIRTRRTFGASLKEATVNVEISIHAKGREAITLPLFRRVTLSVNDEPENMMILPPLDASILDKVMLFRCAPATVPEDRRKTWETILKELPAFVRLVEKHRIAERAKDRRFGVAAYHSPALLELLNDVAPETRLLNLVDEVMGADFGGPHKCWTGTAEELERCLRASPFSFAVEKLLHYSSACGVYLGRLAGRFPDRFHSAKVKGKTRWTIQPGEEE
jgi:hypothetical protein